MTRAIDRDTDADVPIKQAWPRTTSKRLEQLERLGINTVHDLLLHLPRDYADRRQISQASQVEPGPNRTVAGFITAVNPVRNSGGAPRQTAVIYDSRADLEDRRRGLHITWYGQKHLVETIRAGDHVTISGAVIEHTFHGSRRMHQPDIHLSWQQTPPLSVGVIAPIYRLTQGLNQDTIRRLIHRGLTEFAPKIRRSRPGDHQHTMEHILWALHFPKEPHHPDLARRELASDEVLELQMALLQRRQEQHSECQQLNLKPNAALVEELISRLPYDLSDSQRYAIEETRADLRREGERMHRLLQGEVGSGKTAVALTAIIDAVSADAQAVLLTPTEILAEQHFKTITELLQAENSPLGTGIMQATFQNRVRPVNYTLLTARVQASSQRRIRQHLALGTLDFVIGTHSVINEDIEWRNLGLAVADEQHRFGTEQRAALRRHAHYLMLTATPIPRTLQLTLYRDLDVSSLESRHDARRDAIRTTLLEHGREPAYQAVGQAVAQGRQAFVVAPFIEPNEAIDAASVTDQIRVVKQRFPQANVDSVHGQLKPAEIEKRMKRFREGKIQILLATSIIEVGIDIPNATVMLIESAERFGMAQLHQLRGRIGRGEHPGQCFLATTPNASLTEHGRQRLRAVQESSDGMALALADLSNRGEGNLAGAQQSGPGRLLKTGNAFDLEMLERERDIAEAIHEADPELALPEHRALRHGRDRMTKRMQEINR